MADSGELLMTQADRDRLVALKKAAKGALTQRQAAMELKLSERQVQRLLYKMRGEGDKAVQHGLRGRVSNRKMDSALEQRAVKILSRDEYRDFGPTLASEYLGKKHGIKASKETVRQWMLRGGLWRAQRQRVKEVHVWRARRERYGELVQWDTSTHDWLEGRGETIYLVKMIDDATSRMFARFVRHDSTEANMSVLEQYLRLFGRPLEFYTDKASIFTTTAKKNHPVQEEPLPPTQIGRALRELGVGWIGAHSPQAKGRVERSFDTDQDRLVKGLRIAKVKTMEEANAYLDTEYLPEWKQKFTVVPACADDAHRAMLKQHDLAAILCLVEQRVVTNDFTIRCKGQTYQIARESICAGLKGGTVRVEMRRNGELAVRFQEKYLVVRACEPAPKSKAPALKPVESQAARKPRQRSKWMQGFSVKSARPAGKVIPIPHASS
jgi:DNA-binding Lrp family transcriptional regulator